MTHDIVQYRVDRSRNIIEGSGDIEQILVDRVIVPRRGAVDEEQPLEVERRPAHEEGYHDRRCNGRDGLRRAQTRFSWRKNLWFIICMDHCGC